LQRAESFGGQALPWGIFETEIIRLSATGGRTV